MMEPGESIEDYVERRVSEQLDAYRVTDIQQLPLAALRRWSEAQYQEFENDSPLETRLPLLTALPQGPQDGQVIAYDAGDGITWRFRYNAGSTSSYKWEFVGGGWLTHLVSTDELKAAGGAGYADLATVGPTLTAPLAGDYEYIASVNGYAVAATTMTYGLNIAGVAPAAPHSGQNPVYAAGAAGTGTWTNDITNLAASSVVKIQYGANAMNQQFRWRVLKIKPRRVG